MNNSVNYKRFIIFQRLGYLIGGFLPLLVYAIAELCNYYLTDQPYLSPVYILTFTSLFLSLIGLNIGPDGHEKKASRGFYTIQAGASLLIVHFLVLFTGGSKSSAFSFFYLYIPSIVGYTYGKGPSLFTASVVLAVSYFLNLFYFRDQSEFIISWLHLHPSFDVSKAKIHYKTLYALVFVVQITITVLIASKQGLYEGERAMSSNNK